MIAQRIVDPSRNVVIAVDGERVLEPKMMDLLCVLAERQGEVVSREELIDLVWGRSFGSDESLTRAISHVRKAFADAGDQASVIETVPKRGYRLVGEVSGVDGPSARMATPASHPKLVWAGILVLASVLLAGGLLWLRPTRVERPQPNVTGIEVNVGVAATSNGDGADRATAGEVMSQLAGALSRVSLLQVTRDAAAAGQNGAGHGPAFAVEGSLARDGTGTRISIVARDPGGRIVWAHAFERRTLMTLRDRDALVDAIALDLSDRLLTAAKSQIRAKPLQSLLPWELNLLATWIPGSDEVFLQPHRPDRFWPQQRALALDPGYAPAHATWASGLSYDALFTPTPVASLWRARAFEHAERAQALAPFSTEVLYALATYYRQLGDRSRALATLDRVLALQPQHPIARLDRPYIAGLCGPDADLRAAELQKQFSALADDNPIRWVALSHMADLHLALGKFDLAAREAARSREIVGATWNGLTLAAALAGEGQASEAAAVARELRLEWPQLNFDEFERRSSARWCLSQHPTPGFVTAFRALAAADRVSRHGAAE